MIGQLWIYRLPGQWNNAVFFNRAYSAMNAVKIWLSYFILHYGSSGSCNKLKDLLTRVANLLKENNVRDPSISADMLSSDHTVGELYTAFAHVKKWWNTKVCWVHDPWLQRAREGTLRLPHQGRQ